MGDQMLMPGIPHWLNGRPMPKIERGIPIPPARSWAGPRVLQRVRAASERSNQRLVSWANLFRSMAVGDSVLFDWGSNYPYPYTLARNAGVRILTQKQPDGKLRVWRIG